MYFVHHQDLICTESRDAMKLESFDLTTFPMPEGPITILMKAVTASQSIPKSHSGAVMMDVVLLSINTIRMFSAGGEGSRLILVLTME